MIFWYFGAPFLVGGSAFVVAELSAALPTVIGIGGATCGDGDCTNEVRSVQTGTNTIYQYVENGTTKYVGITNDFFRRAAEHMNQKGWDIQPIPGLEQLSRGDARAVEQVLIEFNKLANLYNKINSIARSNPKYEDAIKRGLEILQQIRYPIE